MPRAEVSEPIGGVNYTFMYLTSTESIRTAALVAKKFLPALGKLIPQKGNLATLLDTDIQDLKLDDVFESVANNIEPDEVTALIQKLCSVVMADGKPIAFEDHFKGDVALALRIAKRSFEVNCGDFFGGAIGAFGLLKKATSATVKAE